MTSNSAEHTFSAIEIERQGGVATVWMNRPQMHNAFDQTLIAELHQAFLLLGDDSGVRAVVLAGRGKSFSAGADLGWMKRAATYTEAENLRDAQALAEMLHVLAECPKPTIARVQGAAFGGGVGLTAACDIAIASTAAVFCMSEVKFGITPATVSPYVVRAMGARHATRYFQTAERISAERALAIGLVHEMVAPEALDASVAAMIEVLGQGGPRAQTEAKNLVRLVEHEEISDAILGETARRIATLRASDEAREGLSAFLEKRKAAWMN